MAATAISTDIDICNLALLRLGLDRITTFEDDNDRAALAKYTYLPILYAVQAEYAWNFLTEYETLDFGTAAAASFGYDYCYTLSGNEARILLVDGQENVDGSLWETVGDKIYTDLVSTGTKKTFGAANGSAQLEITGHGFVEDQPVRVLNTANNGLPTGLAEDTTYYVIYVDANTIQLESSLGGGNVITAATGGSGNEIFTYGLNVKYVRTSTTVSEFTPQFIDTLAARLEAEWAERLVKSAALGERKEAVYDKKYGVTRSTDGQQGPPVVKGYFATDLER